MTARILKDACNFTTRVTVGSLLQSTIHGFEQLVLLESCGSSAFKLLWLQGSR